MSNVAPLTDRRPFSMGRSMKIATMSRIKLAVIPAGVAFGLFASGGAARADVTIANADGWTVYTKGRVEAFFSYGWGDALPVARPGETIPAGAGLDPGSDVSPSPTMGGRENTRKDNK